MKKLLLFSILLAFSALCYSQNFKENRKKTDQIKADVGYYWGESGNCKNSRKADEDALKALLDNIADDKALMPLYFQDSSEEDEQHQRLLGTYLGTLKKISEKYVLDGNDGSARVFRCVKKTDFADLCKMREKCIVDYINTGIVAEDQYRCGDALRYYYWALMLCHSHADGAHLLYNGVSTYKWLLRRIESVLNDIVIIPKRQEKADDNEFILAVVTQGNSIDGLSFEYNNGNGTSVCTVNNGVGRIKLVHHDISSVTLIINIENYDILKFYDADVYAIVNALDEQIDFPGAKKVVDIEKAKKIKDLDEIKSYSDTQLAQNMQKSEAFLDNVSTTPAQNYPKVMDKIAKTLGVNKNKDLIIKDLSPYFTDEGLQMLESLLSYGKSSIIGHPEYRFVEFGDEVLCRAIPMRFDFHNNVSFIREMVFRFDKNSHKIKSIAFRLTDVTESQILAKEKWSNEARLTLISFIEDYQTAYALKRRDYLNRIYSDNALIIVGSVLKDTKKTDDIRLKEKVRIKYDTLSKSQYMKRLDKVFSNNEYVNIRFTNTTFNTVNNINNVIGVQLKQEYLSSSYGDVGYLFLMVDLRHEEPVIHVRTWQPNETPVDDIIDAQSFEFK